jgi:hypothetical protein
MEPLLDVRSPIDPKTKSIHATLERVEASDRQTHPSSIAEKNEEERWDAGIGQGGAFGKPLADRQREGLERAVWEFRAQESVVEERRVVREATKGEDEGEAVVAAEAAGLETPNTIKRAKTVTEESTEMPSQVVQASKTAYRFIDTSSKRPSRDLARAETVRAMRRARRATARL